MVKKSFIDNIRSIAIIIALAVLIPLMINYGASTLVPKPSYPISDFKVGNSRIAGEYDTKNFIKNGNYSAKELQKAKQQMQLYNDYNAKKAKHYKTVFWVTVPAGILFILLGLLGRLGILDSGFILGGSLSIVSGYFTYWDSLSSAMRFVSLLVALILIIGVTYYRSTKEHKA